MLKHNLRTFESLDVDVVVPRDRWQHVFAPKALPPSAEALNHLASALLRDVPETSRRFEFYGSTFTVTGTLTREPVERIFESSVRQCCLVEKALKILNPSLLSQAFVNIPHALNTLGCSVNVDMLYKRKEDDWG